MGVPFCLVCSLLSMGCAHRWVGREHELLAAGAAQGTVTRCIPGQNFVTLAQSQCRPSFATCCIILSMRWVHHQR